MGLIMSSCLTSTLRLATRRVLTQNQAFMFHTTPSVSLIRNSDGNFNVTMVPGDGVGPELMDSVQAVLKSVNAPLSFDQLHLSEVQHRTSTSLENVVDSINKNGVALKGVFSIPEFSPTNTGDLQNLNQKFRNSLDIYANVIQVKSLPGVQSKHKNVDFIVVREQTEGEYSALEHEPVTGVVECLKVVTREKSMRIAKFAFDYAVKHGRKKVTAVHKANIMKQGDGLFLRSCEEISKLYPNIEFQEMIVDNTCMQLVSKPQQFDVMVMPNLYGNILANLAAGLVGGAGLVAGEGYSKECAVFEPGARHSYSEQAGKNVANPAAMLLCAANFLDYACLSDHADRVRNSVLEVLREGRVKTKDLGGHATTRQFTAAVVQGMGKTLEQGNQGKTTKSFSF